MSSRRLDTSKANYANEHREFVNLSPMQFTRREMRRVFLNPKFWIGFVAVVLVLAISGPFYTAINLNFAERLSYWALISGVSFVLGLFTSLFVGAWLYHQGLGRMAAQSISGFLAGLPIAGLVWFSGVFLFGLNPADTLLKFIILVLECGLISVVVAMFFWMFRNRRMETAVANTNQTISPFLDRLPLALGKDIISIQSQDHYLRVTTVAGSDMLLMRMADACSELANFKGMQVHRSWWVALDHVRSFQKASGKGTLVLSDGQEVPVSRGFLKAVQSELG
ncbi:MAG: LytTR family transcriptional regulator DNA-binding domain-containing protein [Rhizobiaceae bacterium]|nr:LytTR family transcriptional regulator DNA-binding domain-containing protein [Rhizobiaceae bacterium]